MSVLIRILAGFAGLFIVLLGIGALLPDAIHVERSIEIPAAPATVYPHIANLQSFYGWSTLPHQRPQEKPVWSGPESGVGATMEWGGPDTGKGIQSITETEEPTLITMAVDFYEYGEAKLRFTLKPTERGTLVVWEFLSPIRDTSPFGRWAGIFVERAIGPNYEQALDNLKRLVAANMHKASPVSMPSDSNSNPDHAE